MVIATKQKVRVRKTNYNDASKIDEIVQKCYPGVPPYPHDALKAQINHFPEGQMVVEFEGKIVGFCITFITTELVAMRPHVWKEITGSGFASRHDPLGDFLYGMDVCVDPEFRGKKIGERLYNERRKLCQQFKLKGILFGARIPGFSKKKKTYPTPELYLEAVKTRSIKDPTITFQMNNGFEPVMVLKEYLPSDHESLGCAILMRWENPLIDSQGNRHYIEDHKDKVRICTINFEQRRIASFEEFQSIAEYFIGVAADYKCDFVVFPEFVTMSLLSIMNKKLDPIQSLEHLGQFTEPFKKFMNEAAVKYNINIIGGTHMERDHAGLMRNICYVFLRDGSVHQQAKIHPTPTERDWWDVRGGDKLSVINTDKGPIGVLICYDSEFPELSRHLVDQGAKIIFVPFATDTRQGYLRVRYCCQARTIENQCYFVLSGNTGNLPRVQNMDINYGQSSILTPSDFPFAKDGVAAETDTNAEMVAIADLSIG
ncbi:MAG: GNAT family N-acetyltransferase, partial [Bdellovibrionales bacterium]|nr:GNAT family N-acetyltransferase [Bdellovibrionales bacterium]